MVEYALTRSSWKLIAPAGATVEIQNRSDAPLRLVEAVAPPDPSAEAGEVLFGGGLASVDAYRKYDAPLPNGLYAIAMSARATVVEVLPIGFVGSSSGSTGLDYSANAPTLPLVGAAFGDAGPYADFVLITTIPANPGRSNVDVENTSGGQVVVLRDDGTAAPGQPPRNASLIPLMGAVDPTGAGKAGAQGGAWSSTTFKGRLQIYAPSAAAQVSAFVD